MEMDKNKLPAMYRRLVDVMRGNGYHNVKEMDQDPRAAEKISGAFRITKEDFKVIRKEMKNI
jgi:hypothetical protein